MDGAMTRRSAEDLQTTGAQSVSEGFTPWVAEPEGEAQSELVHTAEDLANAVHEARQAASAETEAALRAALSNDIEQRRCELIAAIESQLAQQKAAFDAILDTYAVITQRLASALTKVVIPRALERCRLTDITEILRATLTRLVAEPALHVRFSPGEAETGKAILAEIAKEVGLSTEVMSTADPLVADGGVEVRWQGGGVVHEWQVLHAEALDIVDHWLGEGSEGSVAYKQMTSGVGSAPDPSSDKAGPVNESGAGNE
jgi:hypothetical protein